MPARDQADQLESASRHAALPAWPAASFGTSSCCNKSAIRSGRRSSWSRRYSARSSSAIAARMAARSSRRLAVGLRTACPRGLSIEALAAHARGEKARLRHVCLAMWLNECPRSFVSGAEGLAKTGSRVGGWGEPAYLLRHATSYRCAGFNTREKNQAVDKSESAFDATFHGEGLGCHRAPFGVLRTRGMHWLLPQLRPCPPGNKSAPTSSSSPTPRAGRGPRGRAPPIC